MRLTALLLCLTTSNWSVEFSNGIVEKVEIKQDGAATATEPNRSHRSGR
jgi:hypothetical protein